MGCKWSATAIMEADKASLIDAAGSDEFATHVVNLRSYRFSELQAATGMFCRDGYLGGGGFGCVFRGWVRKRSFAAAAGSCKGAMAVAVKLLDAQGLQGHKEWMTEIYYLGQLQHSNIIKLIGYCSENDQRLLVYEFMPGGSLDNLLFTHAREPLSLRLRMKIALGAAKGLAFLHSHKIKVIFRDFKTSNILLDSEYNVKLSDFGLATDGPADDESYVSTRVMGTFGYAAPEYIESGHLSSKSDVYSFGVVLLEILTGRPVLDEERSEKEKSLVSWARPYLHSKHRICKIMDSRMELDKCCLSQAFPAANVAIRCLSLRPEFRPTMEEVVLELEQLQHSCEV